MTGTPPAGWYPAPHADNEQRWWDGTQWHDPTAASGAASSAEAAERIARASDFLPSAAAPHPGRAFALTALILGIVAFLLGWVPWFGLALAIAAVTAGITALVARQPRGWGVTGIVLGAVALVFGLVVTASFTAMMADSGTTVSARAPASSAPAGAAPSEAPAEAAPTQPAPTQPAPTEPATEAAAGSVANPLAQPYVAKGLFGGDKYSLTARIVDADADALVEEWNQFNSDAPAGFRHVIVEFGMTGLDPDGVEPSLAEYDLYLATAEGNRYSNESIVFADGQPSLNDGPTLYPGSSFTGDSAFIVPESSEGFLIYDNRKYIRI